MSSCRTYLSELEASSRSFPTLPAFRIPETSTYSASMNWHTVTYAQFHQDVQNYARHWLQTLQADGLPPKSVVGLWISGMSYTDVLQIYGLTRAGYIPQLFSLRLPTPEIIYNLLSKANAKALIFDGTVESLLKHSPIPIHRAIELTNILDFNNEPLPPLPEITDERDIAILFHTSGSTSGTPKLVPYTYKRLDTLVRKAAMTSIPKDPLRQDVATWIGSVCHVAQTHLQIANIHHGSCVVQPTLLTFSSAELIDMVQKCRLNRLNQFPPFLANHLSNARGDPKLLSILSSLDEVLYTGLSVPREDETWALQRGINLKNCFANSECGLILAASGNAKDLNPTFLHPLTGLGTSYDFISTDPTPTQAQSQHQSTAKLWELVVGSTSPDCPDRSLCQADGDFHTGDLFQQVGPNSYIFRGREDDWIKMENCLRCDTKAIENNVRQTCGSLIQECVVVGTARPSPVLFIESKDKAGTEKLKKDVFRKIRQFNERGYVHERIAFWQMIVVVPQGSLPRTVTKGNVRRKAVEEANKDLLDTLFKTQL